MIPKRVTLENFLSFGEPATEIVFADDEPLWVLGGPNGVGKSAVFDAITYCLFGCHRGTGSREAPVDELIRHGTNGFKVVFEFEVNSTDYRITRSRYGRTTQKVEQRDPDTGAWGPVPNKHINNATDVKNWAEETLGLGFDAFKASVLLRQGEADRIITAKGIERLEILKKIIDVERFEALSARVHDKAWSLKVHLDSLCKRRDGQLEITDDQLQAAQEQLTKAVEARTNAQEAAQAAADRVSAAKHWTELDAKRQSVEAQLHAADERAAEAQHIRDAKARLDELSTTLPTLRTVISLRDRLKHADDTSQSLADDRRQITDRHEELSTAREQAQQKSEYHKSTADESARTAKRLREEIDRERKGITAADEVKKLRDELAAYPPDLAGLYSTARDEAKTAAEALTRAGNAETEAETLLKQSEKRKEEFATVGVGAKCSRCGQDVSEEHALRERKDIAEEIHKYEQQRTAAKDQVSAAKKHRETAENERDRLLKFHQDQTLKSQRLTDKEQMLQALGLTADADALRDQLAAKTREAERNEQQADAESKAHQAAAEELKRLDRNLKSLDTQRTDLDRRVGELNTAAAKDRGQHDTLTGQLSPDWQARLDTLDAAILDALDKEHRQLGTSGVAERFKLLQEDDARRDEWAKQRDEHTAAIASIPEAARVPVADAERAALSARQTAKDADGNRDAAKKAADDLTRQASEYCQLVADIAEAEKEADLHKKLDGLLGKEGLQRELVRSAERGIVHLANATVQNLSCGDLSIELEEEPDGADRAFTLQVRRADDPMPIPVTYLSGSQKFRVSVAIALAIGQYAAGQNRKLESVIIDEGFGSLDRDGLTAMATELNRLREHLKRIVLVSHQEEFADRFPVVIKLSHGATGTTAEAIRR